MEERQDLISRQAAIDVLNEYFTRIGKLKRRGLTEGEKAISIDTVGAIKTLPTVQPETHEERTETRACDCISRQAAIDALFELYEYQRDIDPTEAADLVRQGIFLAEKKIENLPSAQPDLSGYSDKLWKRAYERGRAEARSEIVRCKDCKHFKRNIPCVGGFYDGCDELIDDGNEMFVDENFYCGYAERRADE